MNISVMPRDGESKIPISVAGNVLADIQNILTHIGEYLIMRDLKLQNSVDIKLSGLFDLYMDPTAGVTMGTSSLSTSGIVDDALALMERTLTGMGSGAGGYWIDDTFSDPRFRRSIVRDIIKLASDLRKKGGYCLRFSADSMFDNVDTERLQEYLERMNMANDDATCGVIRSVSSRSGRADGLRLEIGEERLKLSFITPEVEEDAFRLKDRSVIVAGRIRYSGERISEVSDIGKVVPFDTIKLKRMISGEGDVSLSEPLKVGVGIDSSGMWSLRNDDLGIRISKAVWDEAVVAFHDYFMFLWNYYLQKDDEDLSEEERDVKTFMETLIGHPQDD